METGKRQVLHCEVLQYAGNLGVVPGLPIPGPVVLSIELGGNLAQGQAGLPHQSVGAIQGRVGQACFAGGGGPADFPARSRHGVRTAQLGAACLGRRQGVTGAKSVSDTQNQSKPTGYCGTPRSNAKISFS